MGITNFDLVQANGFIGASVYEMVPPTNVIYLGNGGTAATGGDGSFQNPYKTLAAAYSAATAAGFDQIKVFPTHAETLTAVQTLAKAGISIIGMKAGNRRPRFTINAAADLLSVTAANVVLRSLEFRIITTDAATAFVNVAAANVWLDDLFMIPSATSVNVVDCITLASGADDCLITNCAIYNTTVPVNSFLSIEAAVARLDLRNNFFFGDAATAGVIDGATATFVRIENNTIGTIGTTIPAAILDNNPTGIVDGNRFFGTSTTIANNAQLGNAVRQSRSYVLESTDNSVQASPIIPAYDTE
jgi:hypothetical protein